MDLRQLEYFVAVAEEGSFTAGARRVHISQSGVSAQIRQLERELGQALLRRTSRSVGLTDAGESFLPHARAAIAAAASARAAVDELAGLVRGHVDVGMVNGCALPVLAELLAAFHTRHPAIELSLVEADSVDLVAAVHRGELDLALIGAAGGPTAGLQAIVIDDEPVVAAVAPDHPLATKRSLTLRTLLDQPLISLPRGTGVRTALEEGAAAIAREPLVVFQASALGMVAQLAARGLGVGILPESVAQERASSLHTLSIREPRLRSRLEVVWSDDAQASPAARTLKRHAQTFLADYGG